MPCGAHLYVKLELCCRANILYVERDILFKMALSVKNVHLFCVNKSQFRFAKVLNKQKFGITR